MPIIQVQLVSRTQTPPMVEIEYDDEMTIHALATQVMQQHGDINFRHFAVRIRRDYVDVQSKVVTHDLTTGVIYVQDVDVNSDVVSKIEGKVPHTVYVATTWIDSSQEGYYPAYNDMTVLQFQLMLQAMATGIHAGGVCHSNFWILEDNVPVKLETHNRKLVKNVIYNFAGIVVSPKRVPEPDVIGSPIFTQNQDIPDTARFGLPLFPHVHGHPLRCEMLPPQHDDDAFSDDDSSSSIQSSAHGNPTGVEGMYALAISIDFSTADVQTLKLFREKHEALYRDILFPKYQQILSELRKRAPSEDTYNMEFAGIKIVFPEREPDCEPEENAPASSDGMFKIIIRDARKEPTVETNKSFDPNITVAKFRDNVVVDVLLVAKSKAKSFNFTRVRGDEPIANFALKVKSFFKDGDIVVVSNRGQGGARPKTIRGQAMVKDKTIKSKLKAEEMNKELVKTVNFNASDPSLKIIKDKVEYMVTKANEGAQSAQDVIAHAIGALDVQILACILEKSSEDISAEKKLKDISRKILGNECLQIEKLKESYEIVLETAEAYFIYVYNMADLNMGRLRDIINPIYNQKVGAQSALSSISPTPKAGQLPVSPSLPKAGQLPVSPSLPDAGQLPVNPAVPKAYGGDINMG